jgi:hypothetical protein
MENLYVVINVDRFAETNITTNTFLRIFIVLVLSIICSSSCWHYSVDPAYLIYFLLYMYCG